MVALSNGWQGWRSVRLGFACATLVACRDVSTLRPADVEQAPRDGLAYFPTSTSWRSADPNAVGLQASRLNALAEAIAGGSYPGVNALIIVRHGYVVTERYFNGTSPAAAQTVQSVTKSVTSLLAGIAIDKRLLTTNARVLAVLPEYESLANVDARKREITLRHLRRRDDSTRRRRRFLHVCARQSVHTHWRHQSIVGVLPVRYATAHRWRVVHQAAGFGTHRLPGAAVVAGVARRSSPRTG
jgi:hypothetical protein